MKIRYYLKLKGKISPIYIALYEGDSAQIIFTGQTIAVKDWSKTERLPKNQKSDVFHSIEKVKTEIQKLARIMEANDQPVTPFTLKYEFLKKTKEKAIKQLRVDREDQVALISISSLIDKWIKDGLDQYQDSTAAVVKTSIRMFQSYIKAHAPRLERQDLSLDIINEYARYLETTRKLKDSTHGKRMKHLRWFLKWIKFDNNQVQEVRIRTVSPSERNIIHLTIEELNALEAVDVSSSIEKQKAKDMFLLGCYTGLRISDLKRISVHRIENGCINMTLKKNRTKVSIPLFKQSKDLLERYAYSAPKISEQQVNESIKLVCDEAGINHKVFFKSKKAGKLIETLHPKNELITSHVAGKTFICLAGERWGLSATDISAVVGKDIKTILGYYLKPDVEIAKQKIIEAENRAQMKVAN